MTLSSPLRVRIQLRTILERIEQVRREVKVLQKLLLAKPIINLPFSPRILLNLSKSQINVLVALQLLGGKASATDVAKLLGINRAMASSCLCGVHRAGLVDKSREHRIVVFRLNVDEP